MVLLKCWKPNDLIFHWIQKIQFKFNCRSLNDFIPECCNFVFVIFQDYRMRTEERSWRRRGKKGPLQKSAKRWKKKWRRKQSWKKKICVSKKVESSTRRFGVWRPEGKKCVERDQLCTGYQDILNSEVLQITLPITVCPQVHISLYFILSGIVVFLTIMFTLLNSEKSCWLESV